MTVTSRSPPTTRRRVEDPGPGGTPGPGAESASGSGSGVIQTAWPLRSPLCCIRGGPEPHQSRADPGGPVYASKAAAMEGERSPPHSYVRCLTRMPGCSRATTSELPVTDLRDQARAALRELVGDDADFRADQFEAIEALVSERRRGARRAADRLGQERGLLRGHASCSATRAPARRCSSLRCSSLMRNQIDAGETRRRPRRRASRATTPTSGSEIVERLDADEIDLLLVSPERFANPRFRDDVLPRSRRASACS